MNKQWTGILAGALLLIGGHTVYANVVSPDEGPRIVAEAGEQGEAGERDEKQEQPVTGTPSLSDEQAKSVARAASGGTPEEAELENELGKLVYSVELTDGREVLVDANSGKVLKIEPAEDVRD